MEKEILNDNNSLLSGIYFLMYKRILKIVLPIMAIIISFANILTICLNYSEIIGSFNFWIKTIGQTIGITICGIWVTYGIIIFIFTILERYNVLKDLNIENKITFNKNYKYKNIINAISIIAGVIQVFGIAFCLFLYFSENENYAIIGFLMIAIIAISLYIVLIALIIISKKYNNNVK